MNRTQNDTTILVDLYRKQTQECGEALDTYKGLTIHALPGLHGAIQALIESHHLVDKSASVIELGAGSGAMSLRYSDMGLKVYAADYVGENFALNKQDYCFVTCDCNQDFSTHFPIKSGFVSAIEIIEHLENPRHFLRECCKLLEPQGHIILTTPNVDSPRSKADFFLEGMFHMFRDSSYNSSGHITPISIWQLYKIFAECGLSTVEHITYGDASYSFKERPKMYLFEKLLFHLGPKYSWGNGAIHILLLKKI